MDLDAIRDVVKASELFKDLPQADLEVLMDKAGTREFSPGDDIYRKGEISGGTLALIALGKVQVVAENGYVVRELEAGEIVGEVGTISPQGKRTVTLKAAEPTRILEWHIEDIEGMSPDLIKWLKDLAWKRMKYYSE
ncbi:MAG: cyclic nucleotide-binding domain-containing protein [Deltaproteobacteria bacterium]|nr:cyclic nucleotide-binding domain-containing protein [Deltaproteobacteria bacterium]